MVNGLYAYFGSNGLQANVQLAGLSVFGNWNSTFSYLSVDYPAVFYGGGTAIAIRDNLNVVPSASTNATLPAKWSPLVLISSALPNPFVQDILISGNTAGTVQSITGEFVFVGGTNVTLSQSSNSVSIIGGAGGGGGAAISAGTNSQNTGTVVFSNSNGVSFGLNTNGALTGTVATNYQSQGAYLTTAMASNAATISNVNVSAGTLSNNLSAFTFSNSNGVSFGLDTNSVLTATVATNYQSQGAYLTTAMQSNAATISNINVSAGTASSNVSALTFANGFGVSWAFDGSNVAATVATNYQSQGAYLTTAMQSQSSSIFAKTGFSSTTTAGTAIVGTQNTNGLSLAVPVFLTTAMASNASTISNINISASNTSANLSNIVFSNSNGISFGLNGSTLTASVAAAIGGMALSAGTNSQNTGTVVFNNSNGISFGLDVNGSLTATVQTNYLTTAMQSNAATISNIKVSGGASSLNLSAITFANSNGISFGLSNNSVMTATVQTNYLTTAMQSNAGTISNVNISAGSTSTNASAFTFSNSNGISFGIGTGASAGIITGTVQTNFQSQGAYLTTAALSSQTLQFTLGGNVATTNSSQILNSGYVLAGGNNVTLQQSNNTVSISVGNYLTTAMQSQSSSVFAKTGFTSTTTAGTAIVATHDTSGLSMGVPLFLTTAMQSNAATISNVNISAGSTSTNASAFTFSNSNGVSFGIGTGASAGVITGTVQTNYLTTAALSSQTLQFTLSGNIATTNSSQILNGGFALAGGNNLTIQQSNNTVSFSVGNYITTAMLSNAATISNVNISASNTSANLSNLVFSNSNGISFGLNGSTLTATVQTNYLTTAALSSQTLQFTLGGNVATTNSSQILNSGFILAGGNSLTIQQSNNSISFSVGNYITTAMQSNAATISNIKISAGANSSNVSAVTFSNGSNVSFGYDGTNITASVASSLTAIKISAGANSSNVSAVTFSNANGISFGYDGTNITGSVGTLVNAVNFSAGAASANLGSVVFSNSNGVSFGLNGSTITATVVTTYLTTADLSQNSSNYVAAWEIDGANTSGTTSSAQGTKLFLSAGPGMTLSGSSNTIVFSNAYAGYVEPYGMSNTALFGPVAGSWYFAPFIAPEVMSGGRINLLQQNAASVSLFNDMTANYLSGGTGTISNLLSYSKVVALYSLGTGSNSTRLESFWSNSFSFGWSKSLVVSTNAATNLALTVAHSLSLISDIGSNGSYTFVQLASASSSTVANSSAASNALATVASSIRNIVSGSVIEPIGFNTTIAPGAYWLAFAWNKTEGTSLTGALGPVSGYTFSSMVGISRLVLESAYRNWGSTNTTARSHIMPYGVYTGATNMAPPQFVNLSSDLSSIASAWVPYFNFQLAGLTK